MTREQIEALARQLAGVAAIFAPGHAAAVGGLLTAATELNAILRQIREEDPATWAVVQRDFNAALAGFEASVQRQGD
jgi:hypothetical protein